MTTLVLEPFGGLAGDMLLAALLDLGDPRFRLEDLRGLARRLVGDEARLEASETHRGGLRATHLAVRTGESERAPHRHLADLLKLLDRAELAAGPRARAQAVLERIGVAEAEVHGIPLERVHFHEVGAVDTLIDVAGAVWALERLEVDTVRATPPLVGSGTVRCAHGVLPVPAPATAILLRGMPHVRGGVGERLTPTGAALLAELVDAFDADGFDADGAPVLPGLAGTARHQRVGYGAGTADPAPTAGDPPNLVRVLLGASQDARAAAGAAGGVERRVAWLLEVTLDDATGEEVGFALEALYAAGALEAWTHAVAMKKGRPGVVMSALCRPEARAACEAAVFAHTPTLGVRWSARERSELPRETIEVVLPAGAGLDVVAGERVRVKVRSRPGAEVAAEDLSPEHDDLARLARVCGRPLRALERAVVDAALAALRG